MHLIVWWFVADGVLFFLGFLIVMSAYHDLPIDESPPPAVDALITIVMLAAAALFVVLVSWLIMSKLRRLGRAG